MKQGRTGRRARHDAIGRQAALALGVATLAAAADALAAGDGRTEIETARIEVVGNSPLAGIGIPRWQLPANVQSLSGSQLDEQESLNLPELMLRQLPSVSVNEIQGNPYQADLNYRGFTASPLLGTAQGLSVYVDGVRVNEPFGDTVNWELLPHSAIAGIDLIPGSNPLYGLNTLGGALAIRTRSGFSHPGSKIELASGSFARNTLELEHGGNDGTHAWYFSADGFSEDGWREHSPSRAQQLFARLSQRSAAGEVDLTLNRALTRMTGNGLLPESMLASRREQVFTHPDQTRNDLWQLALNGRLWLDDTHSLSGNVYYRSNRTRTLNGDVNDEYAGGPFDTVSDQESGAYNRTRTNTQGSGAALQWNLSSERQQLTIGSSYDHARMHFTQTQELGVIDASRDVAALEAATLENALRGTTRTASVFMTDTVSLAADLALTASLRYNRSRVTLRDELNAAPPNLDGDHHYGKLNPALGVSWQLSPALNAYAGLSQGNRVPTPIELGCADPANPCTLPNAMASDPHLNQVVARTLEAGVRGRLAGGGSWNAGVYRTVSTDDIIFVGTSTSAGYFSNFGRTQRQGFELGANGSGHGVDWFASYSYLLATFESSACLLAANNSSRGTAPECTANGQTDEILVKRGDRIPGLPAHSLKVGASWAASERLRVGADVQAFSGQYARGNENNADAAGRIAGYAIVNLNAEARLGGGWQLFGRVNNVFDRRYATAAALAENPFNAAGAFQSNSAAWSHETFVAPGAPRAAWVGVRYAFAAR